MHAVMIVLILGSLLNAATPTPHSIEQFNAQYLDQFEHPVITPDYSHLNK